MNIAYYFKRLWFLLRTLSNPPLFIYLLFHYLNKDIPLKIARRICKNNLCEYNEYNVNDFILETYDGSCQVVHPDIVFYKDSYWLVVTPYPYGMEEYENPCIYYGESLNNLKLQKAPIAVQRRRIHGTHLSDPCLSIYNDKLYCYYRESVRKGDVEENYIWNTCYQESDKNWSKPNLLLNSVTDKMLSPAVVYNKYGERIIYYISTMNNTYSLVSIKGANLEGEIIEHNIIGLPKDFTIWHIGITPSDEVYQSCENSDELIGLLLVKSKLKTGDMRLFEIRNNQNSADWFVINEVKIPERLKGIMAFPYKSCYIPKREGDILLSYRDTKNRNRLVIIYH